jgi:hypothetical protein
MIGTQIMRLALRWHRRADDLLPFRAKQFAQAGFEK